MRLSRHGFSYIQLLVYLSVFLIIFAILQQTLFKITSQTTAQLADLREKKQMTFVLDTISQDVAFADNVTSDPDKLNYVQDEISYSYMEHNNRITRKKETYVYLTPKEIFIEDFTVLELNPKLFKLKIKTKVHNYERVIRWRN